MNTYKVTFIEEVHYSRTFLAEDAETAIDKMQQDYSYLDERDSVFLSSDAELVLT